MKYTLYSIKGKQWLQVAALWLGLLPAAALAQTANFDYTGSPQYYTVPVGVTRIDVVASGAAGGRGYVLQDRSLGAKVQATLAVVPGETLTVMVGQQGSDGTSAASYNGGGRGGFGSGGGGGATDLRRAGTGTGDYLATRNALLVAGGAGGTDIMASPIPQGGSGGTPLGGTGVGIGNSAPGLGATQAAPGNSGIAASNSLGADGGYAGGGGGYYGGGAAAFQGSFGGGGGGSSWVAPAALVGTATYALATDGTQGKLTITPVSAAGPLPVQLIDFVAQAQGAAVVLTWHTASEIGSDRFEIERSLDGNSFAKLGALAAHGTTSQAQAYAYRDAQLPAGATRLYYRLRQVDLDNSAHYSPVRAVAVGTTSFVLFPNPAQAAATLTGVLPATAVQVLDAVGRVVLTTSTDAAGTATLTLPAGQPSGVYIVRAGNQTARLTVE